MTLRTRHIRMRLVSKRTRRTSLAPRSDGPPVLNTHRLHQRRIEIDDTCRSRRTRQLVTRIAVRRQWRQLTFLVVTREAARVRQRPRLERPFLQPEPVADIFRRLRYKLIVRLVLRLVSLMTISAIGVSVLLMRKRDAEIRNKVACFHGRQKTLAQTRKRKPRSVVRGGVDVTVQTDARSRTLTGKELLPVTVETRLVFRILGDVRKSIVRFPSIFPILRWERVTRTTSGAMLCGEVRKTRVVDAWCTLRARSASLR